VRDERPESFPGSHAMMRRLVEVSGSLASPFDENPVIGLSAISKVRTDVGIHLPLEPIVEYHTHDQTMMG